IEQFPGKRRRVVRQSFGELKREGDGKVRGEEDARRSERKGKPALWILGCPEWCACGNGEQKELGVIGAVVNGEKGEDGDCGKGQERTFARERPAQNGYHPDEDQDATCEVAGGVIKTRVVIEDAKCGLEADDGDDGSAGDSSWAGIGSAARQRDRG